MEAGATASASGEAGAKEGIAVTNLAPPVRTEQAPRLPRSARGNRASPQPLVIVLLAAASGMVLVRVHPMPVLLLGTGALATASLGAWLWWRGALCRATLLLLVSIACTAAAWHQLRWHYFAADDLGRFAGRVAEPVCVEAVVLSEPAYLPAPPPDPLRTIPPSALSRFDVAAVALRCGARWREVSGGATLLVEGRLAGVQVGDRLRIFGQLARPRPARNPGEFDFARYARADRKLCELRCDGAHCLTIKKRAAALSVRRGLAWLRQVGRQQIERHVPRAQAGLAAALLLGDRAAVGRGATEPFFLTGTLHLLVVSGLHVGILASLLYLVLRLLPLPRRALLVLAAALVVLYALVTGANPPVLRAATLFGVFYAACFLGRKAHAANALSAAALVVLAINPADLFRTGPQLSFLAVAALAAFFSHRRPRREEDPLLRLTAKTRPLPVRWLSTLGRSTWEVTLAGVWVWLATLPLVMLQFHLLTPAALVLTPLLGPLVWLALAAGFALLLIGPVVPLAGGACGTVCGGAIAGLEQLVAGAQQLPGSHTWVPGPALWWTVVWYVALVLLWAFPQRRPPRRWALALAAAWLAVGFAAPLLPREPQLRATFMAVDHGCAVLVQLPAGETLLYDAGRLGAPEGAARAIAATLWSQGITHLDAVVVSHADADHYNALPELLERFSVGVLYVSPTMFQHEPAALWALREAVESHQVPVRTLWAGDRLLAKGVTLEVYHPPPSGVQGSDNANSIVLAIDYAGRRVLLPGDLESPGLESLLATAPCDTDVLLAPHHGSRRSDPPGFAAWSTPQWVVISSGHRGRQDAASRAYRAAGARVFTTHDAGAVEVRIARDGRLSVENFLSP